MEEDGCKVQPPAKITIKDGRKPAEVYRTDLITAMKIPDYQLLLTGSYFNLTDAWKQEWEKGVQVPVNLDSLPKPSFRLAQSGLHAPSDFKMPNKFINSQTKEEKISPNLVSYDLDDEDVEWLKGLNRSRKIRGLEVVEELLMERAITCLEDQCYTNMGETISTAKGLSIEYDENIACDVCRVPDCEDGNEIVFCDVCDVAVHQACYGVQKVPVGSWVCKPCAQLLFDSPCLLCSTRGGAMKRTKSKGFQGWVHMSCALWVPEVGIGDVEKMEPITRIETITPGRWNLLCYLCKEKTGACIQCSVKTCVIAFHVTCGFNNNLEMQTVLDESAPDGVRHECYCYKHGSTKTSGRSPRKSFTGTRSPHKASRQSTSTPSKSSSAATAKDNEEQENLRQKKVRRMEEEFYKFADTKNLASELRISMELAKTFVRFWTLKRKARDDASLLPPTAKQQECLAGRQTKPYQRATMEMERVVRFRQDLERVRNLCYMVEKREKQKRELTRARESVFRKELEIMDDVSGRMSSDDFRWARACCTKNFTEYETLQTLDFNYPRKPKVHKRHTKKRRRKVKRVEVPSSTEDEVFSKPEEESHGKGGGGDGDCSDGGSTTFTSNVDESTSGKLDARKTVKTSASSSEPTSNEDRDDKKGIGKDKEGVHDTCCASSRRTSKRLEDFSSDSDFEDESCRRARRKRIVPLKLPKKGQQKNGIIGRNDTTSSSPGEVDKLLNGVHIERSNEGCLGLVEVKNLKTVVEIKDIVQRSPKRVDGAKFTIERKRLFCEFSQNLDASSSPKNEERNLGPSRAVLDGQMVLDKFDIVLSPKRYCYQNGALRGLKNDENTDQNRSLLERVDDPKVNSKVSSRTRSRSSDGGSASPVHPTKTDGALPMSTAADRDIRSNCKPCAAIKESLPGRCRTRRSSGQSSDSLSKTSSSSFGNSTQCSGFFGKFRQTATTSA